MKGGTPAALLAPSSVAVAKMQTPQGHKRISTSTKEATAWYQSVPRHELPLGRVFTCLYRAGSREIVRARDASAACTAPHRTAPHALARGSEDQTARWHTRAGGDEDVFDVDNLVA